MYYQTLEVKLNSMDIVRLEVMGSNYGKAEIVKFDYFCSYSNSIWDVLVYE